MTSAIATIASMVLYYASPFSMILCILQDAKRPSSLEAISDIELPLRHVLPHTNRPAGSTADGALLGRGRVERRKIGRSGELSEGYRRRR